MPRSYRSRCCRGNGARYRYDMRLWLALVFVGGCGGPTQQQIVESPSATAPYPHTEAPPASTSDEDRHHLVRQFEDMQWTQNAYREASQEANRPPRQPLQ